MYFLVEIKNGRQHGLNRFVCVRYIVPFSPHETLYSKLVHALHPKDRTQSKRKIKEHNHKCAQSATFDMYVCANCFLPFSPTRGKVDKYVLTTTHTHTHTQQDQK